MFPRKSRNYKKKQLKTDKNRLRHRNVCDIYVFFLLGITSIQLSLSFEWNSNQFLKRKSRHFIEKNYYLLLILLYFSQMLILDGTRKWTEKSELDNKSLKKFPQNGFLLVIWLLLRSKTATLRSSDLNWTSPEASWRSWVPTLNYSIRDLKEERFL